MPQEEGERLCTKVMSMVFRRRGASPMATFSYGENQDLISAYLLSRAPRTREARPSAAKPQLNRFIAEGEPGETPVPCELAFRIRSLY